MENKKKNKQAILAGIVTCNPEIELLKKNIEALIEQVEEILIVDNASDNKEEIYELREKYTNIHIIFNESNKGLATALNQILKYSIKESYEWYLTMDQDSIVSQNLVKSYRPFMVENAAILCPFLLNNDKINMTDYQSMNLPESEEITDPIDCITSASLNQTKAIQNVGGYDDKLFIDCIDVDINIRVIEAGYSIFRVNSAFIKQQMGEGKPIPFFLYLYKLSGRSIFQKLSVSPVYSDRRIYYIARNSLYINKKYKAEAGNRMTRPWMTGQFIYYCLTYPKVRRRKDMIKAWFKGRCDAKELLEEN
ncbi:glycosyltransferase [Ileibacterium valens]|uniref:glycosyltransferase n=1 Tax=Ileibacterium valens TaxID=1862668 RepID=UPI0023570FE9|nr:glycosyltransferase [Ileibacterium valens]